MAVSANGLPGVRPLPAEQGPVKFCKQLTKSDLEQGLYIPTIESRVIRREARADNAQPVLLCVVEAGLDILVRATKWGNYGGALKMTGRGWQDIVTSTRLYVGRQLQVEVIGSFTAPKSASHENPGSAPRAVVLSFRTLQIVHVTDDLHAPATANDASTAPVSQAAQAAKPDAAAVGPGAVTQPAPSRRKRTCAETPPLTSQAATPQAPAAGGTCGSEACAVHLQRMESRISQLEVTPSDVSCPMGTKQQHQQMQTSINMEKSARSLAQREMILQMMGMVPRYHPHQMPPGQQPAIPLMPPASGAYPVLGGGHAVGEVQAPLYQSAGYGPGHAVAGSSGQPPMKPGPSSGPASRGTLG